MSKIVTVVGARPQFIKAASMSRALTTAGLDELIIHTGQHYQDDMSNVFFEELEIPMAAHNLGISSLSHGTMTGRMLEKIEQVYLIEKPDMVLLYGDTNSTVAGALAASKLSIPVAHVEAGLRSFNRAMPEEINRVITDHISDLLFCPTSTARFNLEKEGITDGVHETGDVMFDTTIFAIKRAANRSKIMDTLGLIANSYGIATMHRQENTDDLDRLKQMVKLLDNQAAHQPLIMPLHPRTKKAFERHSIELENVRTVAPLGYLDMVQIVQHANVVYTDSGGLQKEAYFHRVPCVTLRDETEWVETIEAGWNRLWTEPDYRPRRDIPDYGDGTASELMTQIILKYLRHN